MFLEGCAAIAAVQPQLRMSGDYQTLIDKILQYMIESKYKIVPGSQPTPEPDAFV
ncbi:hypothetical protein DCCM_2740 [Desulfocucumis palustris]|uniref:Uncharacterized protein n=1 Tax=Desulfocucumis palustris TaxID=1898651 RepID=A0A2L2XCB2_9FIRM|nr:hypothetical protein DCCM_2740 [Desulfocucumis palustris]